MANLPSVDNRAKSKVAETAPKANDAPTVDRDEQDTEANYSLQIRAWKKWKKAEANLSTETAIMLRDAYIKLEKVGATTKDGRHVTDKASTVRWIIENCHKLLQ